MLAPTMLPPGLPPGSDSELRPEYLLMLAISRETSTPPVVVFFQPPM